MPHKRNKLEIQNTFNATFWNITDSTEEEALFFSQFCFQSRLEYFGNFFDAEYNQFSRITCVDRFLAESEFKVKSSLLDSKT